MSLVKWDHLGNFVVVSKSSQTVINVAQQFENTVPLGCHATVKTTQNIVEIPILQEQMIWLEIPGVLVVAMFHTINWSCLFISAHLFARCTVCLVVSVVFVDSVRMTDLSWWSIFRLFRNWKHFAHRFTFQWNIFEKQRWFDDIRVVDSHNHFRQSAQVYGAISDWLTPPVGLGKEEAAEGEQHRTKEKEEILRLLGDWQEREASPIVRWAWADENR